MKEERRIYDCVPGISGMFINDVPAELVFTRVFPIPVPRPSNVSSQDHQLLPWEIPRKKHIPVKQSVKVSIPIPEIEAIDLDDLCQTLHFYPHDILVFAYRCFYRYRENLRRLEGFRELGRLSQMQRKA